jgi:hypothetical protein
MASATSATALWQPSPGSHRSPAQSTSGVQNVEHILDSAITWIVIAAASEIIALTPLKSNSVIQLVFTALKAMKPRR